MLFSFNDLHEIMRSSHARMPTLASTQACKVRTHAQGQNLIIRTQVEAIESVIKSLETIPTAADFRSMLAKTVPAADRRPCSCDSRK